MRLLYGDSAPFPLGYNFLTTLEAFIATATRIVKLDHDSKLEARQAEEVAAQRAKGLEALEQFHALVLRAFQDAGQKVQHSHAVEYSQKVCEHASQYVESHRSAAAAAAEREAATHRAEDDRRVQEQRAQLDAFLKIACLPVVSTRVSMSLQVDGKEPHHTMSAVFENPDGISTSFALSAAKVQAWAQPRKVAEFAEGADLMVGIDKSWLRGTVQPKELNVDEWFVSQFESSDDEFDLKLRRKLTEKDGLVFHVRRSDAGLSGIVEHPGASQGDEIPGMLSPQDLAVLDRIWRALKPATREVLDHKEKLLAVNLDGEPVFEHGLVVPFVVRLVSMFAPTVREIANRSPNEFELSLKMETDGGKREELYLRKDQLTSKLQALSPEGRAVFAPLGLDSAPPVLTQTPPPPPREASVIVAAPPKLSRA